MHLFLFYRIIKCENVSLQRIELPRESLDKLDYTLLTMFIMLRNIIFKDLFFRSSSTLTEFLLQAHGYVPRISQGPVPSSRQSGSDLVVIWAGRCCGQDINGSCFCPSSSSSSAQKLLSVFKAERKRNDFSTERSKTLPKYIG